jgi:hypothetical protein
MCHESELGITAVKVTKLLVDVEQSKLNFALLMRNQLSDFADLIFPDDEYAEISAAVAAIDRWIERRNEHAS